MFSLDIFPPVAHGTYSTMLLHKRDDHSLPILSSLQIGITRVCFSDKKFIPRIRRLTALCPFEVISVYLLC